MARIKYRISAACAATLREGIAEAERLAHAPYVRPDEETVAALRVHRVGRTVDVTRNAAAAWLAQRRACGGTP